MFAKTRPFGVGLFLFLLLTSAVFSIGCLLIIYYANLNVKNTAVVSGGEKLALVFLLSYIPQLVISHNLSVDAVKIGVILFSWTVFFAGIILTRKINSERIILE